MPAPWIAPLPIAWLAFGALTVLTLGGAVGVAVARSIVYAAFALLATLVGVVGLFAWLSADFLAVVQLLVYIGGILVVILFAIMLTGRIADSAQSNPRHDSATAAVTATALTGLLAWMVLRYPWAEQAEAAPLPGAAQLGEAFLGPYVVPFELAGVVLLAALLGAAVLARQSAGAVPP